MFREAAYYTRLAAGYAELRWARLEPDPSGLIRRYIENREANFRQLARRAIFDRPANPYYSLFRWAGCEYGDLERAIRKDGLESALEGLRRAGVYLQHDEFKGKRPIQRGVQSLDAQPEDFANPLVRGTLVTTSSGSRSRGTITEQSAEFLVYREAQEHVFLEELGIGQRKHIRISSILPSTAGLRRGLMSELRGHSVDRWFALGGARDSAHYRLLTRALVVEARLLGVKVPFPTLLPHDDFASVARWIARRKSEGFACMLSAGVSNTVRVAAAAAEDGFDVSGTIMRVHSEQLTTAKRRAIEATGAMVYSGYGVSELGKIGGACLHMTSGDCVHVCRDSVGLIAYRKAAPLSGMDVDSLLFTTLLPFAPTVLINVEMDDAGSLGPARCDCALTRLGLTEQVSHIFSYGKLTGQGMTLLGSDVLDILERRLPARFGGSPADYQLVEREGGRQTEIELRVHPRVRAGSDDIVRNYFLAELRTVYGGTLSSRNWSQTNAVRVVFAEPLRTGERGKVHALHLLGVSVDRTDAASRPAHDENG